jgi:hypothetical protein
MFDRANVSSTAETTISPFETVKNRIYRLAPNTAGAAI